MLQHPPEQKQQPDTVVSNQTECYHRPQNKHFLSSVIQFVVAIIFSASCLSMRIREVDAIVFFPRGGSYGWNLANNFLTLGNNITRINNRRRKRSLRPLFDRRSFYRTFTGYLNHFEMNGTGCLLRTICEVAASTMEENNGVLGSILKILFMPTTSRPEEKPLHMNINDQDLYKAEWQGRQYLAIEEDENMDEDVNADGYGNVDANDNGHIKACLDYSHWCPEGVINMISSWY